MLDETREIAAKIMIKEAEKLGADAVVCVRYSQLLRLFRELRKYSYTVRQLKQGKKLIIFSRRGKKKEAKIKKNNSLHN